MTRREVTLSTLVGMVAAIGVGFSAGEPAARRRELSLFPEGRVDEAEAARQRARDRDRIDAAAAKRQRKAARRAELERARVRRLVGKGERGHDAG